MTRYPHRPYPRWTGSLNQQHKHAFLKWSMRHSSSKPCNLALVLPEALAVCNAHSRREGKANGHSKWMMMHGTAATATTLGGQGVA